MHIRRPRATKLSQIDIDTDLVMGSHAIIGNKSGSYGGNDTVNRPIAHSLGVIPKHILIAVDSGYIGQMSQHRNGKIMFTFDAGRGEINVNNMTDTYFYVGNAGNYFTSMNGGGRGYYWIAFG